MQVQAQQRDEVRVIRLRGRINAISSRLTARLLAELGDLDGSTKAVLIDLSQARRVDNVCLGLFRGICQRRRPGKKAPQVLLVKARKALRRCPLGPNEPFTLHVSEGDALAALCAA